MLSKSFLKIKNLIYKYLGYKNINSFDLDNEIDEALAEVEKISQFNYEYKEFIEIFDFLKIDGYKEIINNATSYYLIVTTLGLNIDKRIKYYSKIDFKKSIIFDSCASAYLEYMADNFEASNLKAPHTFRFCPGYGKTKIEDVKKIIDVLKPKLGVRLLESNLMVPQKSMAAIIGVGFNNKRSCNDCLVVDCNYKTRGMTCYKN